MNASKETFVDGGNLALLNSNSTAATHTCDDVFDNVPAELRDKNNWIVWKLVPNDDPTKKPRKVPFNPKTGKHAKATDPATWTSYSEAVGALKHGSYAGLGFVFDGSGICGVDLDNVIDPATGEIEPWAQDEIDYFGSYTETSPSGTGFHILCKSDFAHKGVNNGNVEIYSHGRFFTVTGVIYDPGLNTLEDCSKQHRRLYGEYAPKTPQADELQATTCDHSAMTAEDKALCDRITDSKQGQKFTDLFNGQWSEKYTSQSEADSATMFMLAFWTGKDSKQMDRIFRASKLYRDKWDSMRGDTTYGAICISKAITSCAETIGEHKRPAVDLDKKPEPTRFETYTQKKKLYSVDIVNFLGLQFPPRENLLSPWLPSQGLVMLYAGRGIGKTWVALGVAYAVTSCAFGKPAMTRYS